MNAKSLLFASRSNHWSTEDVFFHWLTFLKFTRFWLIFSRSCLLIRPISGFEGFISLQVGLFTKFCLWSLSVINASFMAVVSTRSSMFRFLVIAFASSSIILSCFMSAFL